jgi:hypothetical protein
MRNGTVKSWHLVVGALLAVGPLAAQPTVTFNLTGVNTSDVVWGNSYGIYTSPYYGNIQTGSTPGPTIPVICDDFADNSYVPETWTAYVTQLSSLSSPDTVLRWSGASVGGTNLSQVQAYDAAAVLAVDILNLNNASPQNPTIQTEQEEYSFAMWALFDPSGTVSDPGALAWLTSNGYPTNSAFYTQAMAYLTSAVTAVTSPHSATVTADINAVTIYSFDPAKPCAAPCSDADPPQEFISVNMAEPSSPALLGFDLIAVGGLIFIVRRRFAKPLNSIR